MPRSRIILEMPLWFFVLVYTKTVDSIGGAFWLATQTLNILCYLPPSKVEKKWHPGLHPWQVRKSSKLIISRCILSRCFSLYHKYKYSSLATSTSVNSSLLSFTRLWHGFLWARQLETRRMFAAEHARWKYDVSMTILFVHNSINNWV